MAVKNLAGSWLCDKGPPTQRGPLYGKVTTPPVWKVHVSLRQSLLLSYSNPQWMILDGHTVGGLIQQSKVLHISSSLAVEPQTSQAYLLLLETS